MFARAYRLSDIILPTELVQSEVPLLNPIQQRRRSFSDVINKDIAAGVCPNR